jgi:hypothetical protein
MEKNVDNKILDLILKNTFIKYLNEKEYSYYGSEAGAKKYRSKNNASEIWIRKKLDTHLGNNESEQSTNTIELFLVHNTIKTLPFNIGDFSIKKGELNVFSNQIYKYHSYNEFIGVLEYFSKILDSWVIELISDKYEFDMKTEFTKLSTIRKNTDKTMFTNKCMELYEKKYLPDKWDPYKKELYIK